MNNLFMDEGYIKYKSELIAGDAPIHPLLSQLNEVRTELFDLGLIGVYSNGIGFGNLSIRSEGTQFVITGSATGSDRILSDNQYCFVQKIDVAENSVQSVGKINASSESMTHGAIYEADDTATCVIHIHSREMFDAMMSQNWLATKKDVPYGTPAMAEAIASLVESEEGRSAIFVTAGHDEGVIAYGSTIEEVKDLIIDTYKRVRK